MILKVHNNIHGTAEDSGYFILGDVVAVDFIPNRGYLIANLPDVAREYGIHHHQDCYGKDATYNVPALKPEDAQIPPNRVMCAALVVKTKDSSWFVTFDDVAYLCNDTGKTIEKFNGSAN